jgi:hypothetical protein
MDNQNVSIEMWNINKHRHRTNSAAEGWDSKLNSIIRKKQPNVFLLVQTLKEVELVFWQLKSKEPVGLGQKRRKPFVKRVEIIKKNMDE